ncbi:MAG: metallophosphoesterase [Armatimonadetes bacterium]|nr:metallophosphoesterase [Armatimonadota bacterium]
MTDLHIEPELDAPHGVAKAVQAILKLDPRPEFVLCGGDMMFDLLGCNRERAETQARLLTEALRPLEMPVYHTLGNHDIWGWGNPMVSENESLYGKRFFSERFLDGGKTYYSFDHGGWHFIVLDTIQRRDRSYFGEIDGEQAAWLANDLQQAGPTVPKIVSIHIPMFTIFTQYAFAANTGSSERIQVRNARGIHELFHNKNVKMVFQGHTHVVESCRTLGINYYTGGSVCGEWWKGKRLGLYDEGFSVVDVTADAARAMYHPYGWIAHPHI